MSTELHDPIDPDVLDPDYEAMTPAQRARHDRRVKVLQLRLRQLSETQIAQTLNISQPTVSADLAYIYREWKDRYGLRPTVDPAVIVGQAMALYQETERLALLEFNQLNSVRAAIGNHFQSKAKMQCLKTAVDAKDRQVALLQDLGILTRALGTVNVALPNASEIRRMVKDAVVTPDMLLPEAQLTEDPEAET